MVVLKVEPWNGTTADSPTTSDGPEGDKSHEMFGFQDLASDYYQVLRQKERPAWCRFVWGIVIIILLIFTGYMVYQLLADYLQYNSFVEYSISWQKNLTLPAITICSTNPLNYTLLKDQLKTGNDTKLLEEFNHLMEDFVKSSTKPNGYMNISFEEFEDFNAFEHEFGSLVLRFGPHLYNMLFGEYDYVFRGIGYFVDYLDWSKYSQMTELGVCFELNDDGRLKQTVGGVKGGLVIDLDANVDHYLFTTTTKGFVVFFRDQDETIMLNRGGYVVSPGVENFIKLTATTHTRLGHPHGTCKNVPSQFGKYDHHYESVRECVQRQRMEAMVDMCHCIPWYLADRLFTLNKTDILDGYSEKIQAHQHARARARMKRQLENETENAEIENSETENTENTENAETENLESGDTEIELGEESSTAEAPKTTEPPTTPWSWVTNQPLHKTNYVHLTCGFVEMYICDKKLEEAEMEGEIEFEPCPEPCEYHEWNVEIASTLFPPSEEYFDKFLRDHLYLPKTPTYDFIRENMARVHIYYDELKVNEKVQTKAYEPQNFVAEFGGTVDLFIGFSFFTIFQLIEISVAMCLTRLWQRRRKAKKTEESNSNSVIDNPSVI